MLLVLVERVISPHCRIRFFLGQQLRQAFRRRAEGATTVRLLGRRISLVEHVVDATVDQGQTVLIHGAGGGIGTFAIQWATAIGVTVITTAGSDAKTQIGQSLGASTAINYRTDDFVAATLAATDGRGVDAILDVVGADYLDRNLNCLATDGHLVIIGGNLSPTPLNLGQLIFKGASVTATMLRPRSIQQKADIITGVRRDVLPLVEAGALKPVIDSVVPMSDAAQAHTLLESGSTVGNVVLDNRSSS